MNTFKKFGVGVIVVVLLSVSLAYSVYAQTSGGSNSTSQNTGGSNSSATTLPAKETTGGSQTGGQQPQGGSTAGGQTPTGGSTAGGSNASTGGSSGIVYIQNPLSSKFNSVGGLVQGALEIFSYVVVLFAVLMIVYVGLQFVLAQGEPKRLSELKDWLLWIVIGVAVVIGARIIVSVVINTLQATGTVSPGVIQNANNALQGRP
ncbi:MAG TPA: pilin [Candidatus Paceibacterota bacterium]